MQRPCACVWRVSAQVLQLLSVPHVTLALAANVANFVCVGYFEPTLETYLIAPQRVSSVWQRAGAKPPATASTHSLAHAPLTVSGPPCRGQAAPFHQTPSSIGMMMTGATVLMILVAPLASPLSKCIGLLNMSWLLLLLYSGVFWFVGYGARPAPLHASRLHVMSSVL